MSSKAIAKVGFIGLGRMGKPMASNILAAGYALTVYDLREAAVSELTRLGAKAATSAYNVAEAAEIVELAVVDDAQVEDVLTGEDGVFAARVRERSSRFTAQCCLRRCDGLAELGARIGVQVIDAPVSGGETGAREKTLSYMVGGDVASIGTLPRIVFHFGVADFPHGWAR